MLTLIFHTNYAYYFIIYSYDDFASGLVWAGILSVSEKTTTSGKLKKREFRKKDVSFYESKSPSHIIFYKMRLEKLQLSPIF